jgi:hypothetical protein
MAVPLLIVVVAIAGFVGEVYEVILIHDLLHRPSIVHNKTFFNNDTFVKNITHTHIFNEYRIENSTVSIAMQDGSSWVIPELFRGIERTACTQNTDNQFAIAQFSELATGLNDTVTGVHVTIGSVLNSVLGMHDKSDQIMIVIKSLENQTTTIERGTENLWRKMNMSLHSQNVTGVHATIGSVSKSVQAIETKSDEIMNVLNSLQVMQNDSCRETLRLAEDNQKLTCKVEKQNLQLQVKQKEEEVNRLTQESTRLHTEIEQLKQDSNSQKTQNERPTQQCTSQNARCSTSNTNLTLVRCFILFILLLMTFYHQPYKNKNEQVRKWSDICKKMRTRRRADFEKYKEYRQTWTIVQQRKDKIEKIHDQREVFHEDLENFFSLLPSLQHELDQTFECLDKFKKNLSLGQLEDWTSYDKSSDDKISKKEYVEDMTRYLERLCVSRKIWGRWAEQYEEAKKYIKICAAIRIQDWRRGYKARKLAQCERDRITTSDSSEPLTEIETRPGTPADMPQTPETPPQTQPVVVSPVSKPRARTRARAPVSNPSVQVNDALEECRTDWEVVGVLLFFVAYYMIFVFYVIYY